MSTGNIIRLLRTSECVQQTKLAERIGVTRAYLSQVENGRKRPSLSFLKSISRELKVPLVILLAEEDEQSLDEQITSDLRRLLSDLLTVKLETLRSVHFARHQPKISQTA